MNEIVIGITNNSIWDILRDLVPFVQLKKPEKHSLRSVTFSTFTLFNYLIYYKT